MAETTSGDVIGQLREAVVSFKKSTIFIEVVEPRDAVLARYQPIFSAEHLPNLTEDEFLSFLVFENNHHWTGLHRQGPRMCSDMIKLRKGLITLLNETEPVSDRLNKANEMVSGMGKNVASAILTVARPDLYGVWNNRSEANMKRIGIWPKFDRGESFGSRYVKVNQILLQLRDALNIDLWTLDALWWFLDSRESGEVPDAEEIELNDLGLASGNEQRFGLERHLHEFLRDNWNHVELGTEWSLYQEPGDEEAGYEYPCALGALIFWRGTRHNHAGW